PGVLPFRPRAGVRRATAGLDAPPAPAARWRRGAEGIRGAGSSAARLAAVQVACRTEADARLGRNRGGGASGRAATGAARPARIRGRGRTARGDPPPRRGARVRAHRRWWRECLRDALPEQSRTVARGRVAADRRRRGTGLLRL